MNEGTRAYVSLSKPWQVFLSSKLIALYGTKFPPINCIAQGNDEMSINSVQIQTKPFRKTKWY